MISDEVQQLFDQNTRFRHGGDAERLAIEHKPEQVRAIMDLPYMDDSHELHRLDIYRPDAPEPPVSISLPGLFDDLSDPPAPASSTGPDSDSDYATIAGKPNPLPVVLDFHGGGLYHGHKHNAACRDMHLAAWGGFAIVNANYRLVPEVSFRDQIADAIAVLDWMAEHADEYGLDISRVFLTGDSAATLLDLYLCAVLHSPIVADQLRVSPGASGIRIRALAGVSGMYRFTGGVHGKALGYYYEGFFPTLKERIAFEPYLDMDRLVVDGDLPPIFMSTSAEDYLADNTLEFARILQYRHHDYEVRVMPNGLDHRLDHDFSVRETGLPNNAEAMCVVDDITRFFKRYC